MDGAFSPNDRLDQRDADRRSPPRRRRGGGGAGRRDLRLRRPQGVAGSAASATRIAPCSPSSTVMSAALPFIPTAVCLLAPRAVWPPSSRRGRTSYLAEAQGESLHCLTAVAAAPDGTIFVGDGSQRHGPDDWSVDLMERNVLGRIIACGPALENAHVLLRGLNYPGGLAVAADGHLWFTESFAHRVSRALISSARRHRSTADRDPQHARLSVASRPRRRRRLLAQSLCRAYALDRVRAAGGRFPRGHDADDFASLLDRARADDQRRLSGTYADRRDQGARHPETLGAATLLRARSRGSTPTAKWRKPCTAGWAAAITASPRPSKRPRGSSSYPKAAAVCCCSTRTRPDESDRHSGFPDRNRGAAKIA